MPWSAISKALPDSEWTTIALDRRGPYTRPQVHEDTVTVRGCAKPLRQIAVRGLGHDHPTLVLTNNGQGGPPGGPLRQAHDHRATPRGVHPLLRSSTPCPPPVALNVDLDTILTVAAQLAYDGLRRRLPGYETANPDTIWRRSVSTKGSVVLGPVEVVVRLGERTYSPVLRAADLPTVSVPWWGGRRLRFELPPGKRK